MSADDKDRVAARIQALLAHSSDSISVVGPDGTILLDASPHGRLLGYANTDLGGVNLVELIHPDEVGAHLEALGRVFATPDAMVTRVARTRHQDGSWRFLEVVAHNLTHVADVGGVVLTCRDVTERMEAQSELRSREALLREVTGNVPAVLFRCCADGPAGLRFIYVSDRARAILGVDAARILEDPEAVFAGLGAPDALAARELLVSRLRSPPVTGPGALEVKATVGGEPRWLRLHVTREPAPHDGTPDAAGLWLDVTAERQAREEREHLEEQVRQAHKVESLATLAGGLAHDFNNLLVGVRTNASTLADLVGPTSPLLSTVKDMELAAEQMAALTWQLLSFAGRAAAERRGLDLSAVVRDTLPLVRASLPPGLVLHVEEPGMPVDVDADPAQLLQVLLNLVINATEAQARQVSVGVDVTRLRRSELGYFTLNYGLGAGRHARLWVEDDGVGMDPALFARVFEPFFTTKREGRGLGLSVTVGVVRMHGGALRVDSAPGRGTRFEIYLPRARAAPEVHTAPPRALPVRPDRAAALLLDDEPYVRHAMALTVQRLGLEPLVAADVEEALRLLRTRPSEILVALVDASMPDAPDRLVPLLKAVCPGLTVIACSGLPEAEARGRLGDGVDAYLAKPFSLDELRRKLDELTAR